MGIAIAMMLLVSADDGWRRLEVESRAPSWARSSNSGGNRVPFAPEDIAMSPPWLLPNQQPQIGFPAAQAQVRSFFDEEPIDWPPRANLKPTTTAAPTKSIQPQQPVVKQQQPQIIHTSLQPPRIGSASNIQPVQHIWYENGDIRRPPVPQRSSSQQPAAEGRVNQQLTVKSREPSVPAADLQKLVPPPAELSNNPYRTAESSPAAGRHQKQPTASRKSVTGSYDSSEYDYEQEDVISAGHQEKRPSGREQLEGPGNYHSAAVEAVVSVGAAADDFYDSPAAKTTPAQRRNQQRRPQQPANSAEQSELEQHQSFDASKTIFRTQVRPQLEEIRQRERPSPYSDEAKQPAGVVGRRQQQQQQRPSERNPSELPATFEAERPSFHSPNLQATQRPQQPAGPQHRLQQQQPEWPQRQSAVPEATRKSKPRIHPRPEEATEAARKRNPAVPRYPEEQEVNQRDHHPRPPYHNPPAPYRPLEEEEPIRPEYHHQPTYEFPPEEPKVNKQQRPRRPPPQEYEEPPRPTYQEVPEENSYDPYENENQRPDPYREQEEQHNRPEENRQEEEEQQHHQVEEPPRPAAPAPGSNRRPPNGRPSFHSGEQFGGADNGNGQHFNGPPQRPQGNNRQRPPHHQRPRDSVVTQGLNTLKVPITSSYYTWTILNVFLHLYAESCGTSKFSATAQASSSAIQPRRATSRGPQTGRSSPRRTASPA